MTSATRPPWPSTSALVASVVDIETSLIADGVDRGLGQHRIDRARYADREVVAGGQRLGLGDDARRFRPQHGVGVGAAGVDAQKERAGEELVAGAPALALVLDGIRWNVRKGVDKIRPRPLADR